MQKAVRRFGPVLSLNVVFVITLAGLLAACVFVVMGMLELLSENSQGAADPRRFIDTLR